MRRAPALSGRAFRRGAAAQRHRWDPDRPGWPGRGPPAGAASHVTPGLLALSLTCGLPVGGLGPERTGTAADSAAESESGGPPRPPAGGHFDGAPTLRGSGGCTAAARARRGGARAQPASPARPSALRRAGQRGTGTRPPPRPARATSRAASAVRLPVPVAGANY